jgi:hypothetical protein
MARLMGQFQKICVVQVQGALQLAFILCRLIPLLNLRKPLGIFYCTIHSFIKKGEMPLLASPTPSRMKKKDMNMQIFAMENLFCNYGIEEFIRFYFIKLRLDTLSVP